MEVQELAKRSCGTCRERRVLCDRATPICLQCSRSKRKCKGYGLRLSWPRAGNEKRAVIGKPTLRRSQIRPISEVHLVHVSQWDVQMYHHLTALSSKGTPRRILFIPMMWNPTALEVGNKDLLQYFQCAASQSLTTFGDNPTHLGRILMRIALSSNTPSAGAVLQSLLALSSLHRDGVQRQAVELKIAGIRALLAASKSNFGAKEIIQHVAAGMLLCSFEVHQSSCTSSQWTWYIAGVKDILNSGCLKDTHQNSDLLALTDWVYYHDVLARFTLRHWQTRVTPPNPAYMPPEVCLQMLFGRSALLVGDRSYHETTSTPATLELLSEVCDAVSAKPNDTVSLQELSEYKAYLRVLDWRVRNVATTTKNNENLAMTMVVELFRLAILVYLYRASGDLFDQRATTQSLSDKAFALMSQLSSCERQFPVFILGCEARTDDQRETVLSLIARTEKTNSSRSLNHVKILIQAVWAQDDLADRELDYLGKLSFIISCCSIVPSLV